MNKREKDGSLVSEKRLVATITCKESTRSWFSLRIVSTYVLTLLSLISEDTTQSDVE
jgi:hypothetical protein